MWKEGISNFAIHFLSNLILIRLFPYKLLMANQFPICCFLYSIGLFKWCTFWRWNQKFSIPFTELLIILIYSDTLGVQHVYFCLVNAVIFICFITDVFSLWEIQNYRILYLWQKRTMKLLWIILVWIWLIQRFVMIYWIVIQDHVIPVYWYIWMNHTYMCIFFSMSNALSAKGRGGSNMKETKICRELWDLCFKTFLPYHSHNQWSWCGLREVLQVFINIKIVGGSQYK